MHISFPRLGSNPGGGGAPTPWGITEVEGGNVILSVGAPDLKSFKREAVIIESAFSNRCSSNFSSGKIGNPLMFHLQFAAHNNFQLTGRQFDSVKSSQIGICLTRPERAKNCKNTLTFTRF